MMTPAAKSCLQAIATHWKKYAATILIAVTSSSLSGCITTADGQKKFAPLETLKRADHSVDNYYNSM